MQLPACTNITYIRNLKMNRILFFTLFWIVRVVSINTKDESYFLSLRESYKRGRATWIDYTLDRPYMSERQLSNRAINGMECKTPCSQTIFSTSEPTYSSKTSYRFRTQYNLFNFSFHILILVKICDFWIWSLRSCQKSRLDFCHKANLQGHEARK